MDAIFKYNNGRGALLCSQCGVIIKTGKDFTDYEWRALRGEVEYAAKFCKECEDSENSKTPNEA